MNFWGTNDVICKFHIRRFKLLLASCGLKKKQLRKKKKKKKTNKIFQNPTCNILDNNTHPLKILTGDGGGEVEEGEGGGMVGRARAGQRKRTK